MTAMARPKSPDTQPPESVEDDPLVELARIVSGRSTFDDPRPRTSFADEPGLSEADLARDLEVELLSDLQASFAAASEGEEDEPPFYAEEDIAEASEAYAPEPFGEQLADGEEPYADGAYAEDYEQGYYVEPEPQPTPPPAPSQGGFASAFAGFGLRGRSGGPAYNPSALAEEPAPPAMPAAGEPLTGWAATAEQTAFASEVDASDEWIEAERSRTADAAYEDSLAAAEAFTEETVQLPPTPPVVPVARHRDRRLDADPEGVGARQATRRRTSGRYYTIFGVLALVAIGTAAVLVLRGGGDTVGEAPLIAADDTPTRIFPEETAAEQTPNAVFDRVAGAAAPEATLLPGAEPVANVGNAAPADDGIGAILAPTDDTVADPAIAANMPRMVRTVTVQTDGTIVENDTVPANGAATPAADDTANAVAVAETPPAVAENATPGAETPPVAETPAAEPPVAEAPAVPEPPAEIAAATPDIPAAGDPIAPGLYVQVAALGTEALAQSMLQDFRARAPSLLQSAPAVIQRADLPAGTYYRVWFGPFTSGEADALRQGLAAVGIESFIQAQN